MNGQSIPWEACITLNDNWGYHSEDKNYKSTQQVIRSMVECISKNGNLLLNVGPDAKGEMTRESLVILDEVGSGCALMAKVFMDAGSLRCLSQSGDVIRKRATSCMRTSTTVELARSISKA